ncbi:PREDICTED: cell adhesion molecule 3 isoform X3 [Corvus brachyrhynchos]|uniref:cell adhesion molecule 3 isoform X3 n=1 Tax=Corvus brachyrhynchos TaxID=85066 RepID=UPI00081663C7|nr:PREDICTED: cell adhesion molecule 3 isoform X3 [Corvus brachyrhynchos]
MSLQRHGGTHTAVLRWLLGTPLLLGCSGTLCRKVTPPNCPSPCAESQPTTSDETVVAGGTVVLKCQVEDPDDSSLQWSNPAQQTLYFGEKRALRDNRIQLERSTPNELTISISDVVLADEGEYTCSIFTMPVRTAKALVTVLGIPQKPQIFGHEQPIDEEKVARLICRSSGSKPAAKLRWRKGNREIKDSGTEVVEDPNGKTFTVTSRVEFRVTKEDNEVEITCTVDHESLQNSERSTTQRLQVHYKPTAKIEPHPQYPREGEKLQLQCDGQGNPIPQEFLWEKEGSDAPLQLSSDSVLIFPFLNKSDSGTYVCTATSSMGSVVAKYNLDVSDVPQLPTPHVHSTPAPPPGPSQPISHASMASAPSFTPAPIQDASPVPSTSSTYHAMIGGVVAVIVFLLLSLLIVLGHYLIRHKGLCPSPGDTVPPRHRPPPEART